MNPALPLLLLLSASGLVWRRRGIGGAIAVSGLAASALLLPSLLLPDGIPSPAASLSRAAPWLQTADPAKGSDTLRDVTHQIQPWLLFLRSEVRSGRLPFWNPHQGAGAPFWANGQSAPLFPFHLLFVLLPLQLGFVLLPWLRLVTAGVGAWALARALGLHRPGALAAAVVFSLSGMLTAFVLYPMGNALALVPWVLLAVERLAAGGPWWPLAAIGGLQLLAGHPETALHTALLGGLYLFVRGGAPWRRRMVGFTAGWLVAAAVAGVQLLPFVAHLPATSRWQQWGALDQGFPDLTVVLPQALRLLLPELLGQPAAGTWFGPFNYLALSLYVGLPALLLALVALPRTGQDRRWLGVAVLLLFSFAGAFHLPGIRELLAAPPILGRALHHRLIFGLELGLALFAGAGLDRWLAHPTRRSLVAVGSVAAAGIVAAWWGFSDQWLERDLLLTQVAWSAWATVALLALLAGTAVGSRKRRLWWPVLVAALALDLVAAHGRVNPGLSLSALYPTTPAIDFLVGRDGRVAGVGPSLHPNAAMVYGLHDVRVDDPLKLVRYEAINADLGSDHPWAFLPIARWDSPWLDSLGVRWVVAPPGRSAPMPRWRLAYDGRDARIFERPGARAIVRLRDGAGGEARVLERSPGRWVVDVETIRATELEVAEMAARGWMARIDGQPTGMTGTDGPLLSVRVPPGRHRLELIYRPPGIAVGAALSLAGILTLAIVARRRRGGGTGVAAHP